MNLSIWLKVGHVFSAIVWLGGGVALMILTARMVTNASADATVALMDQTAEFGKRLFMPASMGTLGFGVALVVAEPSFRFSDLWIILGLGGVAVSVILGAVFSQRTTASLRGALAEGGRDSAAAKELLRRLKLFGWADLAILFVVAWAMIAKPSL
ncbi:MAG TPA: DUF2269 family protein [Egibacteraceae bacterium]|nr:DUF2269 family protein [Egibacteraceae bacterium]